MKKHTKLSLLLSPIKTFLFLLFMLISILSLKAKDNNAIEKQIHGISFLEKIMGQWEGSVISNTPAGNFDTWYVDFRPVSASQVSQYSIMDANTINYTSFFVIKYNEELRIAMRTEGVFMNQGCVTYEVMDSLDEASGYYRFSDFQAGIKRAYTEFIFNGNNLTMQTYTTKFNTQEKATLHSKWDAVLADRNAAAKAQEHFDFPQAIPIKDFTDVFTNLSESIYFSFEHDPYPRNPQPYVGSVTVTITIDESLDLSKNHELFIVLSTAPLFDGLKYQKEKMKYFSKYAYMTVDTKSFHFTNVHPGTYYIYAYNDVNNDKKHETADYMSSNTNNIIEVFPESNTSVETLIDFIIP
jgi:hypothetical protein